MNETRSPAPLSEEFGRKLRAVRLIQDLCLEANAYWQLPEIFRMVLHSLDDVLGFANSMIYLLNSDGATLSYQAGRGYPDGYAGGDFRLGEGFVGVAAKTGEVLRVGNLHRALQYTQAIRSKIEASPLKEKLGERVPMPGLRQAESMLAVPLKTRTGVIGVILVESDQIHQYKALDQELLLLVAGQTARLIADVRQEENNRRQLESLNRARQHLNSLNAYLGSVTSAAAMTETATYAAAMAKHLKGLVYASTEAELAKACFEEAAGVFQGMGMVLEMARSKLGLGMLLLSEDSGSASQILDECATVFEDNEAPKSANLTKAILAQPSSAEARGAQVPAGLLLLTKREREIAVLVGQGLPNKEVASRLGISVRTATTHLERIYHKLGVRSRSELAYYIYEQGRRHAYT